MTRKQIDKLMKVLLNISASLIVLGAIFRLQHWPYGIQIIWIGLLSSFLIGSIEIYRLRKVVKMLDPENAAH